MNKLSTRDLAGIGDAVVHLREFQTHGALRGQRHLSGRGWLLSDDEWNAVVLAHYIVYSYDTPIAWYDKVLGVWTVSAAKYTVTTSKHQGAIRGALALRGLTF